MSTLRVGEFERHDCGDTIRVGFSRFDELILLDIRQWSVGRDDELVATRKGICVPPDRIGDLLRLLTEAHALAVEHGLVEGPVEASR